MANVNQEVARYMVIQIDSNFIPFRCKYFFRIALLSNDMRSKLFSYVHYVWYKKTRRKRQFVLGGHLSLKNICFHFQVI
jgi:hypothetical protein